MAHPIEHEDLEDLAGQIFDVTTNPLADILTKLLHALVVKGILTKDEAVFFVADAIKVIRATDHSEGVKENGADMLARMIRAIDPERQI